MLLTIGVSSSRKQSNNGEDDDEDDDDDDDDEGDDEEDDNENDDEDDGAISRTRDDTDEDDGAISRTRDETDEDDDVSLILTFFFLGFGLFCLSFGVNNKLAWIVESHGFKVFLGDCCLFRGNYALSCL